MNTSVETHPLRREDYDAASSNFALPPFLESAWVEALAGRGRRPAYFEFRRGPERVGLVAGLEVFSPWRVFAAISKLFYIYGLPPLEPGVAELALRSLRSSLQAQGFNAVDIAFYYNPPPPRVAELGFRTRPALEYRLDLSPSLDELHKKLDRRRRKLVQRGTDNGLCYEESSAPARFDDLLACLQGTKHRRTARGVGRYSYYYIPGLDDAAVRRLLASGLARVCTVSRQGRLVSAALVVRNRHYAFYLLSGATPEGYELWSPTFMLWHALAQSKIAGCRTLNLCGVPKDKSSAQLAEFKRSFGAEPHACEAGSCFLLGGVRKLLHRSYKVAAHPRSYAQAAGSALWKRLVPLSSVS